MLDRKGNRLSHRFRDLLIWQRSMQLVTDVYSFSQQFPKEELFGLTSQLRRAVISVPLNIAEGAGSDSSKEFCRFLNIALRSLNETITAVEIPIRLNYCISQEAKPIVNEAEQISSMIVSFSQRMQNQSDARQIRESNADYFTSEKTD